MRRKSNRGNRQPSRRGVHRIVQAGDSMRELPAICLDEHKIVAILIFAAKAFKEIVHLS
jgi:hypothetical protein